MPLPFILLFFAAAAALTFAVLWLRQAPRMAALSARLHERDLQCQNLHQEREALSQSLAESERQSAALAQQLQDMKAKARDWEVLKSEHLQATKASMLEVGAQLSSKLLEDHKRELEQGRKQAVEATQKTTENLQKEFVRITQQVGVMSEQLLSSRSTVDRLWKALSVPSEAGYFAEIGLENCFRAFGLAAGRDYLMQHTITGEDANRLRPDALVLLPQDTVMVVDSKSSIFLLERGAAEETPESLALLKKTMQAHLKGLAGKDYRGAVQQSFRAAGRGGEIRRLLNVMYLPHEGALERIGRADPDFLRKCMELDIVPAGPTGLAGLVALCRMEIDLIKQAENHEHILSAMQDLLESLGIALNNAASVGKSLKAAADHFHNFTKSVNGRLLPRARKLGKLGIRPTRNKELPHSISSFSVLEENTVIEGELDDESPLLLSTTGTTA